jgi:hypothetical protein
MVKIQWSNIHSFRRLPLAGALLLFAIVVVAYQSPSSAQANSPANSNGNTPGSGPAETQSQNTTLAKGFYVATNGNDNNPGTLSEPFATLRRAQTAMKKSSIKTTYIRAGHYKPVTGTGCNNGGGATVYLTTTDTGETWSYYPPDGYNSAILDGQSTEGTSGGSGGNGTGCAFSSDHASNITIIGLQFENYRFAAFSGDTGSNIKFEDNVIHNMTAAAWGAGAIASVCTPNTQVKNNYIYNISYAGIVLTAGPPCPTGISDDVVSGNVILNSCTWPAVHGFGNDQNGGDCGAIYFHDGTSQSTNIQVNNNYIRDINKASKGAGDYGINGTNGCCADGVYTDTGTHNVSITGNVIAGMISTCVQMNDPQNNVITGNICDLASDSDYQSIVIYGRGKVWPATMTGNTFRHNIVLTASSGIGFGYLGGTRTPDPMVINDNAYYNYVGSGVKYTGNAYVGSDSGPVYEDPQISGWTYNIASDSPVFSSPVSFPGLQRTWGPPGFSIPQTGTAPSCPH